jgi:hypothetical protein
VFHENFHNGRGFEVDITEEELFNTSLEVYSTVKPLYEDRRPTAAYPELRSENTAAANQCVQSSTTSPDYSVYYEQSFQSVYCG